MQPKEAIGLILKAKSIIDVFSEVSVYKSQYKTLMSLIHPDVCKEANSHEAVTKLNGYKDEIETGKKTKDDVGEVIYKITSLTIKGSKDLLKTSLNNYKKLMSLSDPEAKHYQRY